MTGLELLEKYPRAASVIKNWLLWKMVDALQNESIDEEFKQYMRDQGIENDKIAPMIDANPRMLFDIFDEHEVFISINITYRKFTYRIDNLVNPTEYSTRKECELISITRAFEILENKLTPKEETNETDN
jgi:hypothetical protein